MIDKDNLIPDSKLLTPDQMRKRIQTIRRNREVYINRPKRPNYISYAGDSQKELEKLKGFEDRIDKLIERLKAIGEPWQ